MIREIIRDEGFLALASEDATVLDKQVAKDLAETLHHHEASCIGMAANMIGVRKKIICIMVDGLPLTMLNPRIIAKKDPYQASEGCLSLKGMRNVMRYRWIRVVFQDLRMRKHERELEGREAQAVQHECDHLDGIVI